MRPSLARRRSNTNSRKSALDCERVANEEGPTRAPGLLTSDFSLLDYASRCSRAALRIAFCSFSKARTSIWRTRSRLMPYCWLRSSSVVGSSFSRRSVRMCRSRSLSVLHRAARAASCACPAPRARPARISWLGVSSTSQSCHSPSPSPRSGALSE